MDDPPPELLFPVLLELPLPLSLEPDDLLLTKILRISIYFQESYSLKLIKSKQELKFTTKSVSLLIYTSLRSLPRPPSFPRLGALPPALQYPLMTMQTTVYKGIYIPYRAVALLTQYQGNVMEHKVINQTSLVQDIISLRSDIKVTSPTNEPQCADLGGYDLESYSWHLVSKTTGSETLVIQWQDQTWEGVKAA